VDALVSAVGPDGRSFQSTALCEVAATGHLDVVRLLLDHGADPSLARRFGYSPLMAAAGSGHVGVVRELGARGAALDAADPATGVTAYHMACGANQPECVAALVEVGCDTRIKAKDGNTGKQLAEQKGHTAVLERLREAVMARLGAGAAPEPAATSAAAVGAGAKALWDAARAGDVAEVGRLLDGGAEADALSSARTPDGCSYQSTALGQAASAGHLDVVQLLLDRGTDPSLANSDVTPLMAAARRGHLDVVRLLLDRGADPSLADGDGDTPLMMAAWSGHVGVVRELVARGAALDAADPVTGVTAYHMACAYNQPECVAALVELGCDTGIKDNDGLTGKQAAEHEGHTVVLERLREAVVARLGAGAAPEPAAASAAAVGAGAKALCNAGRVGDVAEVGRLLDSGAKADALVSARAPDGHSYQTTALGEAAWTSCGLDVVRLLLDRGADPSLVNSDGDSPLMMAARRGHLDIVRLLLDRGADPSLANSDGCSPLMNAAFSGHVGVVRELAARGAALDAADSRHGATAYHMACDS
jgi:ankyrin repeat protein